ncbi:MAG: MATE family efflux transporter [Erysipelotrichaceae bacterium]|jgi:putative MATE family efflux protein
MRNKKQNLTEGNIISGLIAFALPLIIGQLFQTLYHSIDAIVVGKFVDSNALAAVNASTSICNTLVGFFTGLSVGVGVVFAKYYGAKNYEKLQKSIQTTVTFTLIFGAIIALIGVLFSTKLLSLMKVDSSIVDIASTYMRIYMIGVFFTANYNVAASIIRSIGDSISPLLYLVISSFIHIFLDLLFVRVFNWGVNGVGWSTVIAQFITCGFAYLRLRNMDCEYALDIKKLSIDSQLLKEVLSLGLPAAIQSSITSIGNIFTHRHINGFGKKATAGIPTGQKIDQFAQLACKGISLAIPTFIAQNLGAKKYNRAVKGVAFSILLVMILTVVPSIFVYIFANQLARIFTNDIEVINIIVGFLHTVMPLYGFMGLHQVFSGINKGFYKAKFDMINNIIGMVVIRQIWLTLSLRFNYVIENIYWCYPITWAVTGICGFLYYEMVVKKEIKQLCSNDII